MFTIVKNGKVVFSGNFDAVQSHQWNEGYGIGEIITPSGVNLDGYNAVTNKAPDGLVLFEAIWSDSGSSGGINVIDAPGLTEDEYIQLGRGCRGEVYNWIQYNGKPILGSERCRGPGNDQTEYAAVSNSGQKKYLVSVETARRAIEYATIVKAAKNWRFRDGLLNVVLQLGEDRWPLSLWNLEGGTGGYKSRRILQRMADNRLLSEEMSADMFFEICDANEYLIKDYGTDSVKSWYISAKVRYLTAKMLQTSFSFEELIQKYESTEGTILKRTEYRLCQEHGSDKTQAEIDKYLLTEIKDLWDQLR